MSVISGPYTWTYDGKPLGMIEDAPRFRASLGSEVVTGDNLGETIQAVIHRGGNLYMDMVLQEFDAEGAQAAFWPFASGVGAMATSSSAGTAVGCTMTGKALVGTKVPGSCATPDVWTAPRAILAPGYDVSFLLGSRLRNVPISFLLMPVSASGEVRFFVGSTP